MKEDVITLPLGTRFIYGNDIVEVQKAHLSCSNCLFFNGACSKPWSHVACTDSLVSHGQDVCFVKVGKVGEVKL